MKVIVIRNFFLFFNIGIIFNFLVKHYLLKFNSDVKYVKLLRKIICCSNYLHGTQNYMFYYYYNGGNRIHSYFSNFNYNTMCYS